MPRRRAARSNSSPSRITVADPPQQFSCEYKDSARAFKLVNDPQGRNLDDFLNTDLNPLLTPDRLILVHSGQGVVGPNDEPDTIECWRLRTRAPGPYVPYDLL